MTDLQQFTVNLVGTEANTLFMEPVYQGADIKETFRVMPMVSRKKSLAYMGVLEDFLRKYTGCGFNPVGKTNVYEREISTELLAGDVEQCWDEFRDTIYETLLQDGVSIADITPTILFAAIESRVRQGVKKDLRKIAFMGDVQSTNPTLQTADGLWTLLKRDAATNAFPRLDTSSGTALSAGDGIDVLRQIEDRAPLALKGISPGERQWEVSGSVYMQYVKDIENGGGGDFGLMATINGISMPTFRGTPVKANWDWDQTLASIGQTNQHLVYFGVRGNLILAGNLGQSDAQFKMWYNEEDEKVKIKTRFSAGFNYVHPSLMSVGY
ncbi:MAG: hypothetical protein ACRCVX_14865 [Shewanella sp.]